MMTVPRMIVVSFRDSVATALRSTQATIAEATLCSHRVSVWRCRRDDHLLAKLEQLESSELRNAIVVVDVTDRTEAWSATRPIDEQGLAVRLILSFPEVYFVFCDESSRTTDALKNMYGEARTDLQLALDMHTVSSLAIADGHRASMWRLSRRHADGFRCLFDPTGLRARVARRVAVEPLRALVGDADVAAPECEQSTRVPSGGHGADIQRPPVLYADRYERLMKHAACASDEELSYAYLAGYAAYKSGMRTWIITSAEEFDRVLPENANLRRQGPLAFDCVVSDWQLEFASSRPVGDGSPQPATASFWIDGRLRQAEPLILVTRHSFGDEDRRMFGAHEVCIVPKPFAGFSELLSAKAPNGANKLKQLSDASFQALCESWNARRGVARDAEVPVDHSAPHASLLMALSLVKRARAIRAGTSNSVTDWVHGSVLAGCARELLGGKTATATYEAIAIEHECELSAELEFYGVSAQIHIVERLSALNECVKMVAGSTKDASVSGHSEMPDHAGISCTLRLVDRFRQMLTANDQLDAADDCVRRFAELRAEYSKGVPSSAHWQQEVRKAAERVLEWYSRRVTDAGTSLSRLVYVNVVIIAVFGVIYCALHLAQSPCAGSPARVVFTESLWHSALTMVTLQTGDEEYMRELESPQSALKWCARAALWTQIALAYTNLGLFISVLYRRVTQRAM